MSHCLNTYLSFSIYIYTYIYISVTDKQNIISITLFASFLSPSFLRRKKKEGKNNIASSRIRELRCIYGKVFRISSSVCRPNMKYRDNELIERKTYIVPFMSAFQRRMSVKRTVPPLQRSLYLPFMGVKRTACCYNYRCERTTFLKLLYFIWEYFNINLGNILQV